VDPYGPAARSGLKPGDVILSADDIRVESSRDFVAMIKGLPTGEILRIGVLRGDSRSFLNVRLIDMPEDIVQFQEGRSYLNRGRNDLAIDHFTRAIQVRRRANFYNLRAEAYRREGLYDEAISDYTQAIYLKPEWADPYAGRGSAALKNGQLKQAIVDCTMAIKLLPEFVWPYNIRGIAWLKKREADKAITDFSKAISLDKEYGPAYTNRGHAYAVKGNYKKAIADLTRVIEMHPLDTYAYLKRSKYYKKLGKPAKAKEDYEGAAKAYMNRGLNFAIKKQYEKAISSYNKGIELDTRYSAPLYYNRGISNEKQGLPVQALLDYKQAIEQNPEFAEAYLRRGFVYAQILKEYENARKDWEMAHKLDPGGKTGQLARNNLDKLRQMQ
jgi:tetratricopeptide (TPR) repeat protein